MFNLNSAFDRLRKKVPTFAYEKRLSRIDTLRLAMTYIRFMSELINEKNVENVSSSSNTLGMDPPIPSSSCLKEEDMLLRHHHMKHWS